MPGLAAHRNDHLFSNASSSSPSSSYYSLSSNNGSVSSSANGFWSKHRDDISYNQLQKFWSELSPQARQNLLRIDKHTLFEQARKNMYCSRCNGLLLEGFMQIVMYGKSLQQNGTGGQQLCSGLGISKDQINGGLNSASGCQDETQDPSVHPWGGLTTTRDGALTLLDCYLYSKSLKGLQNVFDSARARERERELLYPDACGGGARGWISQGIASYGRGHGTRETCALHTARLSCETLVDFWSALGEETRQSLLRMKEEDFIERLMYRFDSKRFCRDCRRNVIREFKELKELKRMRKEPRCTSWFCVADTAFQYEVWNDAIHADWHQTFIDSIGTYHHFEWAVGSGEGKSDILEFENVGMNGSIQVNGLDLGGLNACYITLRAWKLDGRCTEFSVKAHALKGRQCVHCRLIVGDGYVTITRGESISKFFEHAEEAEEEEDDDSMDKDGNDLDGECSRPQKHAKSPELAREFLLDAATVIFKEQVEKAFREGTARQNAHSIFVCLALKLLEERIHVACKEIITLEKQMKLLEEEEKEKREEEERKERKRTKEREKKLRRKERLRGKDKGCNEQSQAPLPSDAPEAVSSSCIDEEADKYNDIRNSVNESGGTNISESDFTDVLDESSSKDYTAAYFLKNGFDGTDGEHADANEGHDRFTHDNIKGSRRKSKVQRDLQQESAMKWSDRRRSMENGPVAYKSESSYYDDCSENLSKGINCLGRQSRTSTSKFNTRNGLRFSQKVLCASIRISDKNDQQSCGCNQQTDYRVKVDLHSSSSRFNQETRSITKLESLSDPKSAHRINKFNPTDYIRDHCIRPRSKISSYGNALGRDSPHTKRVWEPVEPQKRYPRSNSDSDVTLRSCSFKTDGVETDKTMGQVCSIQISEKLHGDFQGDNASGKFKVGASCQNGFHTDVEVDVGLPRGCNLNRTPDFSASSSSNSDNCSSCLSEGDSNTPSSNHLNMESSSTSDSEDSSQQSEGREISGYVQNSLSGHDVRKEKIQNTTNQGEAEVGCSTHLSSSSPETVGSHLPWNSPTQTSPHNGDNGKITASMTSVQGAFPSIHNPNVSFPVFQGPSTVGYYHHNPMTWSTAPANGLMQYPHSNHYLLPSPFGYGLNGDSHFCLQYGPVQHLVSPFMNGNQIPVYQPVPGANCLNPLDQANVLNANGVRDPSGEPRQENVIATARHPTEAPSKGFMEKENESKSETGNTGFSLFQFPGPVALPTYRSNLQFSDEGKAGDLSSCCVAGDQACTKKETTIEEYNLFAASNGIQFSIF